MMEELSLLAGKYPAHKLAEALEALGRAERMLAGGRTTPQAAILASLRPLAGRSHLDTVV